MNPMPILWRECKITFTNSGRMVNHFLNPTLMLILFAIVFSLYTRSVRFGGETVPFVDFFVPGLLALQVFSLFTLTFSTVRIDNSRGFLADIAISKTSLISYYSGSLLANTLVAMLRVILLAVAAHVFLGSPLPGSINGFMVGLVGLFVGSVFWYSLGFVAGVFVTREDLRDVILSLLIMPTTFASTVYYNLDQMPRSIGNIVRYNPLTYNVNILRDAFLVQEPVLWRSDFLILVLLAVSLSIVSCVSVYRTVR
jgi:ABC-2 type transport system permease protein